MEDFAKMKKMMPLEFKRYLAEHTPKSVRYDFDAQNWFDPLGVCHTFRMSFPQIDVWVNPTRIRIFNPKERNYICFEDVKYVQVDQSLDGGQGKINIVCSSPAQGSAPQSRSYTLMVN